MTVEEKTNKIYKKKYTVDVRLQQYFKKVLAMTGTDAFIVFSSEDLEQTSGGLAVWEDGYIIENLLPIWGKGHLILIEMLGSTASEQDNLSKKVR